MTLRKMHEASVEDRTIQLFGDDAGVPEIFAEGIHGIRFAGTHVKVNLYTVAEDQGNVEQRQLVARLVMPVGSYLDMSAMLASHAGGLRQNLGQAIQAQQQAAAGNGAQDDSKSA
ncbi:MAG: hypothetical protein AAF684_06155 [Pseudomonadota bacterium]